MYYFLANIFLTRIYYLSDLFHGLILLKRQVFLLMSENGLFKIVGHVVS